MNNYFTMALKEGNRMPVTIFQIVNQESDSDSLLWKQLFTQGVAARRCGSSCSGAVQLLQEYNDRLAIQDVPRSIPDYTLDIFLEI